MHPSRRRGAGRCLSGGGAILLVLAIASAAEPARADPRGPAYPRLANIYLHGAADPASIPRLARWDVLVLDAVWSDAELEQIRARNPDVKIFFYICAYCMRIPPPADPWWDINYRYVLDNDLWWRNADRTIASDWPGVQLVNLTDRAAAGPWGTYRKVLGSRLEWLVQSRPQLDGVFFDNFWKGIAWEQGTTIHVDSDCNPTHNPAGCDGVEDAPAALDTLWNRALRDFARDVRQRFDRRSPDRDPSRPLAIVTNGSADYFPWLNGTMHEYFPSRRTAPDPGNPYGYNWMQEMFASPGGYLFAPFREVPYRASILNATWDGTLAAPARSADFERHKRFTLVSTLLGDGYYSLDPGATAGHGSLWWEPEYDGGGLGTGYLGYPRGPMQRIGAPSGPESVVNGGFTTTTWPWQTLPWNATGSLALDWTTYRSAPSAARIDLTSVAPGGSFKLHQTVPVFGGDSYLLSFWARSSAPQEIVVHLYADDCPNLRCLSDQRFQVTSQWTLHELPFVTTAHASSGLNIFVQAPGTLWIDDVSLRTGEVAIYRRDFERGIVLLNYTPGTCRVPLGRTYYRLRVPGSDVWDGAPVSVETIPPSDGRILLVDPHPTASPPPEERGGVEFRNEPDPFGTATPTEIRFRLPAGGPARLAVYDTAGRLVRMLLEAGHAAGGHEQRALWDGTDAGGRRVPPGIYFARLTAAGTTRSEKMTVVR
jgi:hypothetical protein